MPLSIANNAISTLTSDLGAGVVVAYRHRRHLGLPGRRHRRPHGIRPPGQRAGRYSSKTPTQLLGLTRGLFGTPDEFHPTGAYCGVSVIAEHIAEQQVGVGTTLQRAVLGLELGPDDIDRWFFDTSILDFFIWDGSKWQTPLLNRIEGFTNGVREYIGEPAQVLPGNYLPGDRWLNTLDGLLRRCVVSPRTNTLADWATLPGGPGATARKASVVIKAQQAAPVARVQPVVPATPDPTVRKAQ